MSGAFFLFLFLFFFPRPTKQRGSAAPDLEKPFSLGTSFTSAADDALRPFPPLPPPLPTSRPIRGALAKFPSPAS